MSEPPLWRLYRANTDGARLFSGLPTQDTSGTVASIDDPSGLIGPISPGETFTGSFSYETGVPDLNPDPSRGD
jgi:hypothetical protein